ncbi:hypothetical protein Bbelb_008770 [Branchiostoma belcheri]|nr:hypothetical protein Bbelb_008770 [Branchiostoma belcheri]
MQAFNFGSVVCLLCVIPAVLSRSVRHRLECRSDEYYSRATHHCEACKDLCHPQRDTLGQCRELCPAYQLPPTAVVLSLHGDDENEPTTSPGTTIHPVTPTQELNRHHEEDKQEESIFWRYGTVAGVSVNLCITVILAFVVHQQQREIRKLWRLQSLSPLQHQVHIQPPRGLPNNPPQLQVVPVPPLGRTAPVFPGSMDTQRQPREEEPLLAQAMQPTLHQRDGSTDVPTAPSNRVPIYTTDTKPHTTSDHTDLLRQDQSATRTPFETEI